MNLFSFRALTLLCAGMLTSCMLPRNHSEVMHGNVRGGKVPLYKTGSMDEFYRAGLILPDVGGYVRAEFDVLDIGADGRVSPACGDGAKCASPVAQVAIPSLVSSYDLSRSSCEMRAAVPATAQDSGSLPRHSDAQFDDPGLAASMSGPNIAAVPSAAAASSISASIATPSTAAVEPSRSVESSAPLVASRSITPPPQMRPPSNARWATNSYFQVVALR